MAYTLTNDEQEALQRLAATLKLSSDDPDGQAVLATAKVRIERLTARVEELEYEQELMQEVLCGAWAAAGGGDVADLATLCDRLPDRIERLRSGG